MSILEKMKEYWVLILGIVVIGLIIGYLNYILTVLGMIIAFHLIFILIPVSIYAIGKSVKTGFMVFFLLLPCATYNPNLEQFDLFIEKEMNISHNKNLKIYNVYQSDWLFFTIYKIKLTKTTVLKKDEKLIEYKVYLGILKNFWRLSENNIEKAESKMGYSQIGEAFKKLSDW